ncbi:MAG: hypothetical protein ACK4FJ_06160 [Ferrovibrio sp.]
MSAKPDVFLALFNMVWPPDAPEPIRLPMTITGTEVREAIQHRNRNLPEGEKVLGAGNPANFLKDFIRKRTCNENWPRRLKALRYTARQRYGNELVFEFVPYRDGDDQPFPDRYDPVPDMPVHTIETLSMKRVAKALGREDEPWLTQIIVNQRIAHTHLAIYSPLNVVDFDHLQMSVKTQPEIDALFLATISDDAGNDSRVLMTCEAKQFKERILEDQIREQVQKAFGFTETLEELYRIDAVLPTAVQVIQYDVAGVMKRGIYMVEFELVRRDEFLAQHAGDNLYRMPLNLASRAFYLLEPPVVGISSSRRANR